METNDSENVDASQVSADMEAGSCSAARRNFLRHSTTVAMAGGLVAGYGAFFAIAGRFVYPASGTITAWQFVAALKEIAVGQSLKYVTPAGANVVIARQSEASDADAFIALSSICPHLGCQVHWEVQNDRFFCPCHNGVFDASGNPKEGPPAAANQKLTRFPLRVEDDLLYIEVPVAPVSREATREA
ncbi:MAG: ubiquinol-cytochrome c reductase iron-sulfur subunit [Planctomycetales bacterium]